MPSDIELTNLQRAAVEHRGSNVLVKAVPGSGKTRVIVARCAALLREGILANEILVLTFSRKSVEDLGTRLGNESVDCADIEIRTFHGFAARLLADAGEAGRSRRLLSEPAERALFEYVVSGFELQSLPRGVAESRVFREAAATRVAEIRRSPDAAVAELREKATPRLADLVALEAETRRVRDRAGLADLDDLIARAVRLGRNPENAVARALQGRYKHVLVDEFQDTDPLQVALLALFNAEIFAVGDEAQAIYGFRGAARDAMTGARDLLHMEIRALDESFRCPSEICDVANSVLPPGMRMLTSRVAEHGHVAYRRAATAHDEASLIANEIAAALETGTPESEIAILLRRAEPLGTLVRNELRARGIASTRRGGEALINDIAVDALIAALRAFATPDDPDVWTRLFGHPAFALDALAVRLALAKNPARDVTAAAALIARLDPAHTSCGTRLSAALRTSHAAWERDEPVLAAKTFAADSNLLEYVIARDEDRVRSSGRRIADFFDALGDVMHVHKKLGRPVTSVAVLDAFLANGDTWRPETPTGERTSGVSILTVHAAKGLEFAFAIVADAVDGHFPQTWRASTLLDNADVELARACRVDLGVSASEHDVEERSLWYVAATRSKRKLLVTWSETDLDGSPLRPSAFIPLAARVTEHEASSYRGPLEYDLSPSLTDVQQPVPAAIPRSIGTSSMETWFTCRRKFYYQALLRIGGDARHFGAKLGTIVHAAISTFHDVTRDFRNVDADAHHGWAATLKALARTVMAADDAPTFDSPLEAEAAIRSADRLLTRYAKNLEMTATSDLPTSGPFEVVASEKKVSYAVGGLDFSGRIDRIDRRADGTLVLVDVKTGKIKDSGAMRTAFKNLADAFEKDALWTTATAANPQLVLYRYAEPQTGALSYLYLGSKTKIHEFNDVATDDRLDLTIDENAIAAVDRVLAQTFFMPWTTGAVVTLEPTQVARTCRFCEFEMVCPGYVEDDVE